MAERMTPEEYAAAEGLPEQRPDLQSTTEDILADYAERIGLPYTPEERAAQVENRRQMAELQDKLPKQTTETYHAGPEQTDVEPEEVLRFIQTVREMYDYVGRLIRDEHTLLAESSRTEARDQWDTLRLEYDSYQNQNLPAREFIGALRHAYTVLLKIKERFEPSESR